MTLDSLFQTRAKLAFLFEDEALQSKEMPDSAPQPCVTDTVRPVIPVEQTLAIIKPDVVKNAAEIEDIILKAGFTIVGKRRVVLSPEQASDFYAEHQGKLFFSILISYMSSGPIIVLQLARDHAVSYWKDMLGPTDRTRARVTHPDSLRAVYGQDIQQNGIHGSHSCDTAAREIRFFFPNAVLEPVLSPNSARDYLAQHVSATLLQGLAALCRAKPTQPITWLADWLLENNPNKAHLYDVIGAVILPPPQ